MEWINLTIGFFFFYKGYLNINLFCEKKTWWLFMADEK